MFNRADGRFIHADKVQSHPDDCSNPLTNSRNALTKIKFVLTGIRNIITRVFFRSDGSFKRLYQWDLDKFRLSPETVTPPL